MSRLPTALTTLLAAAVLALAPSHTDAQVNSRSTGFMLGGHVAGSSISVDGSDRSAGPGGGATVAYGFGSGLGVFGQMDYSKVDVRNQPDAPGKWGIWHWDLGARYHFGGPAENIRPFVQAAVSLLNVTVKEVGDVGGVTIDQIDFGGYSGSVGGGVQLHVVPAFAFEVSTLLGWGNLTDAKVDGVSASGLDFSLQAARLNMGAVVWLFG
jgi:hypothetical protein